MVSLDLKMYVVWLNLVFGIFVRTGLTYYLVITAGYGLIGVYWADMIQVIIKLVFFAAVILYFGESYYVGVKH